MARTATELVEAGHDVPDELVVGIEDLAAVLCAVADDPRTPDPEVPGVLPTGASTRCSVDDGPTAAHELSEELAAIEPTAHDGLAGQLATQVRLLAEDVAALTGTTGSAMSS